MYASDFDLTMNLIPLVQVDPTKGRIVIDGIDISTIGIHDLRSRLVSPLGSSYSNLTAPTLDLHPTGIYQESDSLNTHYDCVGCIAFLRYSQRESGSFWLVETLILFHC